ncbi:hypothetical protein phytr_8240 [Candidatus Phycorickettsia trachydisci]|uniref:UDP-2,3-diacylglucosamine pyrophosphatase n=1 Tax=Candidatus Phycorickettsia trachydisci TaxID=2115978 RepID=A0A2P1P918_9RICK|nr:UDP-2,3-diacylglucosamine diphosphatase LpxI [Candidatus Phycorickettsia trachydisci]AVP87756.1 hypothetical protein phytr_8240 [Candidatus Phycorickettsia trachydisci]
MSIGILAGGGNLPQILATNAAKQGREVSVIALDGFASVDDFQDYNSAQLKIGQVKKIIQFLQENNVKEVVFAGKVTRLKWSSLYVDSLGSKLLAKIAINKVLGDDKLLNIIMKFVEEYNFKVISPLDLLGSQDINTKAKPSKNDLEDIKLGLEVLEAISVFDIGQSVIVENGYILGIEGAEGTDELILRTQNLKRHDAPSGVLVKAFKSTQNSKLDIPTIGPTTLENAIAAGLKGIAIGRDKVIILEADKMQDLANQANMFVFKENA